MRAFYLTLTLLLTASPLLSAGERPEPRYKGRPLAYWLDRLQKAETDEQQAEAARALKAFGSDAAPAVPKLIEMLDDRSAEYREVICDILRVIGPGAKAAVPQLVRALKMKTTPDPETWIVVLGAIGPDAREAVPVLIEALEKPELSNAAHTALCAIGPAAREAIPAIARGLRRVSLEDAGGFLGRLWEVHKLGPDVVPVLREFLDKDDVGCLSASARGLGYLGAAARGAVPRLTRLLEHQNAYVRRDAAWALWAIARTEAVIPVLAALLKEDARSVAEPAAEALGEIGPAAARALPALEAALSHEQPPVRQAASLAISKIRAASK
jgi:HEAT repeat protein